MLPIMEEMCNLKLPQLMGGTGKKKQENETPTDTKYMKGLFTKHFCKWL